MRILCIDTSLDVCSVALTGDENSKVCFLEEKGFNIHSARLTLMIETLMDEAGINLNQIDAVCIDKGPGSYTGLRIGVSTAKGLCYALDKPLMAINTLETMTGFALDNSEVGDDVLFCPMIDARRMEVYYTLYNKDLGIQKETRAEVVDENFLSEILNESEVLFFGNGMDKCRNFLETKPNAKFLDEIYPKADYIIASALVKYKNQEFEDLFSFEPFYLKDFMTTAMINNPSSAEATAGRQ